MEYTDFVKKLKETRIKKRVSQTDLAKALGRSPTYISFLEKGRTAIRIDDYLLICKALQVDPSALFEDTERKGDFNYIKDKLANFSNRDFRIIKDLIMLMSLNQADL
jgi:transcriptional regulator with XRE-family HTH domain